MMDERSAEQQVQELLAKRASRSRRDELSDLLARPNSEYTPEPRSRGPLWFMTLLSVVIVLLAIYWEWQPDTPRAPATVWSGPRDSYVDPRDARIAALSDAERNCLGIFLKYDRVRASDLTMSQLQGIQACQALGLYHDLK